MLEPGSQAVGADYWFSSETQFNALYPEAIRQMTRRHWTPMLVARQAADFLNTHQGVRILDIGSGVGKFCLAAAHYHPDAEFVGIEQRPALVQHAQIALQTLGLGNVQFLTGNFRDLDFKTYQHFYFYNSFYENIAGQDLIDREVDCSSDLFNQYSYCLFKKLREAPEGTRLVTYHSLETEIPENYHLVKSAINDYLKFWIKV